MEGTTNKWDYYGKDSKHVSGCVVSCEEDILVLFMRLYTDCLNFVPGFISCSILLGNHLVVWTMHGLGVESHITTVGLLSLLCLIVSCTLC